MHCTKSCISFRIMLLPKYQWSSSKLLLLLCKAVVIVVVFPCWIIFLLHQNVLFGKNSLVTRYRSSLISNVEEFDDNEDGWLPWSWEWSWVCDERLVLREVIFYSTLLLELLQYSPQRTSSLSPSSRQSFLSLLLYGIYPFRYLALSCGCSVD